VKDKGLCGDRSDLVARIKRLRRIPFKGATKKRTFKEVAEILNKEGYTTKHGGKFTGNNVAMLYGRLQGPSETSRPQSARVTFGRRRRACGQLSGHGGKGRRVIAIKALGNLS
jgi:hypothetical protein